MFTIKRFFYLALGLLFAFILYTMYSTGFFRSIGNVRQFKVHKKLKLPGTEDMVVSRSDKFAIISSTKRNSYPATEVENGGLYFMDMSKKTLEDRNISGVKKLTDFFPPPFAPHGISMIKIDSARYKVAAINHTPDGHFIEFFNLNGDKLSYEKTVTDPTMISPNDLVLIDETRFYFTNDHRSTSGLGKFNEEYLGARKTNVVYFDGNQFVEVADGIAYANGINYDRSRKLLYVASPRDFLVKVYKVVELGDLQFEADIYCGSGVDNIELDEAGNLWIGAHPSLLHFNAYNKNFAEKSPSEILKVTYKNKDDYTVETMYLEDGSMMSGSSVAVPFGNYLLTGNVKDNRFLVLKK